MSTSILEQLQARAEIGEVLVRYATGIDGRDQERVRSCYHPGAHDDHGDWQGTAEEFVDAMPGYLGQFVSTMHVMGLPSIVVRGDEADADTYAVAYHRKAGKDGGLKDDVWGVRYVDRFEKRDGEWRIASRVMTQVWRRVDPVAER